MGVTARRILHPLAQVLCSPQRGDALFDNCRNEAIARFDHCSLSGITIAPTTNGDCRWESPPQDSMSRMIGMPLQNRERAVHLLQQNHAR
jgi:hypothetical protein